MRDRVRSSIFLLTLAAMLVAGPARANTFSISGTSWFNEGTEAPSVCMTFEQGGRLTFKGGFLFYNPSSRWESVPNNPELIRIFLGGTRKFPSQVSKQQIESDPKGSLASYDVRSRSLVYRIGFGNMPIQFNGLLFELQEKCEA